MASFMDTLVGILRGIYRLGSFVEGFGAYLPSGSFRVTVTDFKLFAMTSGFRDFENPKLFSWAITVRREALSNRLEGAENGIRNFDCPLPLKLGGEFVILGNTFHES
jgi:hypothetical protein